MGDRIFSLLFTVSEATPAELRYRVSVGFKGSFRRLTSEVFSIFVVGNDTPQQLLNTIATAIEGGDIDAAVTHFSPSPLNAEILNKLTVDHRRTFAAALRTAVLIKTDGNTRVFQVPWTTPTGQPLLLKMILARAETGEWVVISW